ncbi:MAG: ABC transporter permease [Lachnospiraceae bacterium]|nr:ABC transporter permease [Lachnospiraceae bacterium]
MTFFKRNGMAGKLARLSAKGRKRENRALFFVLFLLFLLTGAIISWISIAKRTEVEQRLDAYGEWKAAVFGGDERQAKAFVNNPRTTRSGISKMAGSICADGAKEKVEEVEGIYASDPMAEEGSTLGEKLELCFGIGNPVEYRSFFEICGQLGTLDEGCMELGRIFLEDGRIPESADEIAVTRSVLLRLGFEEKLGQEISFEVISDGGEVLECSYRLCGVLGDYGGNWQTKGYPLVSAVISEEAASKFPWEMTYNIFTDVDGTVGDTRYIYKMAEEPMDVIRRFSFNSYAYDFWGRTDQGYIWLILFLVVIIASTTVFQIADTQMRKRSRQVGLLKAIGATEVQIRGIFLREVTEVLWKAALSGTILGIVLVPAILWGSGLAERQRFSYSLDLPLLLGAVGICFAATWTGAVIPVRKGRKIPICGEVRLSKVRLAPMKARKNYPVGRLVAGRNSGGFRCLSVLLLAAMASTLFLASYQVEKLLAPYRNGEKALYYYLFFDDIRHRYEENPMSNTILEQLMSIPGVEGVWTRKNGVGSLEAFYISYEGVENCELERLRKQRNQPPYAYVHRRAYLKRADQAMTALMGIYTGWESNLEGLSGLVTEGEFHREAFESGEEVLLFLPPYREMPYRAVNEETGKVVIQTDKRYQDFYEQETCIRPGDTITLIINWQVVDNSQDGWAEEKQNPPMTYEGTREFPVKVGGIIRYLPQNTKNPLWNLNYGKSCTWENDVLQAGTVIASGELVDKTRTLYQELLNEENQKWSERAGDVSPPEEGSEENSPGENRFRTPETERLYDEIEVLCDLSVSEATEGSIKSLAETYGLTMGIRRSEVSYETWKKEYSETLNKVSLFMIAAFAGSFIVVCLLLRNVNERLMEDRRRLGIFQAMGIQRQKLQRSYIWKGLENGVLALFLAHGVLFGTALWQAGEVVKNLSPYRFESSGEALLYRWDLWFGSYDWLWHGLVCTGVLIFAGLLGFIPLRGILKNNPVENIRELGE